MSAYQMGFSFREPYQVLLDSNFLKACHSFHMPLQKYLENTLHGESRLFVTKCTLAKIMGDWEKQKQREKEKAKADSSDKKDPRTRSRGPGRPEFLPPPTELPLRHCKHKNKEGEEVGVLSETHCLLDLLAGQPHGNEHAKNKQHYILASADADEREQRSKGFIDVRERARLIPGVPIVYVKRSVMILEELSGASERVRNTAEKEKFSQGLIGTAGRKRKREDENDEENDEEAQALQGPRVRGMKRAKGPNPLSVKKKKVKAPLQKTPKNDDDAVVEGEGPQKSRRRGKRGRKQSAVKDGQDDVAASAPTIAAEA